MINYHFSNLQPQAYAHRSKSNRLRGELLPRMCVVPKFIRVMAHLPTLTSHSIVFLLQSGTAVLDLMRSKTVVPTSHEISQGSRWQHSRLPIQGATGKPFGMPIKPIWERLGKSHDTLIWESLVYRTAALKA